MFVSSQYDLYCVLLKYRLVCPFDIPFSPNFRKLHLIFTCLCTYKIDIECVCNLRMRL